MQTLTSLKNASSKNPTSLAELATDILVDAEMDKTFRAILILANGSNAETVRDRLTSLVNHVATCFEALNATNVHVKKTLSEFACGNDRRFTGTSFRSLADWILNSAEYATIRPNSEMAKTRRERVKNNADSVKRNVMADYSADDKPKIVKTKKTA